MDNTQAKARWSQLNQFVEGRQKATGCSRDEATQWLARTLPTREIAS